MRPLVQAPADNPHIAGCDMLFVLGCGMRGGARAGLLATAGVATSEAVHLAVAAAGLAALFAAVPVAFTVVRVAGAAYLIHLGVRMLRDRKGGVSELPELGGGMSGRRAYLSGLLTNLLNPKMVTFTIAFLPQFVEPALGRVWLRGKAAARRRVDVATGGIFIGFGVQLAVDR